MQRCVQCRVQSRVFALHGLHGLHELLRLHALYWVFRGLQPCVFCVQPGLLDLQSRGMQPVQPGL